MACHATRLFLSSRSSSEKKSLQSSQVDLLARSEICNGAAVVCDAAGVTLLGGACMLPPGNFEKWK